MKIRSLNSKAISNSNSIKVGSKENNNNNNNNNNDKKSQKNCLSQKIKILLS